MCGILCVFGLPCCDKCQVLKATECRDRLAHRGPDSSGIYVTGGHHILAHRRLLIVGSFEGGQQPLLLPSLDASAPAGSKVVCVANGEIYNHLALRNSLKMESHSDSDSEVLLQLYRAAEASMDVDGKQVNSVSFLNKLNGAFAVVMYDEARDSYFVARDHIGIVPLYMGWAADGSVWFASELKALATECVIFQEFPPGCAFISQGTDGPKRHPEDVVSKELTDAHLARCLRRWYNPTWYEMSLIPSTAVDFATLRSKFEDAVQRRLMCDVPYGVLLSGGLDSSLVSSIVSRFARKRVEDEGKSEAHWPRVHSFSIGLEGSPDLAAAKKVAAYLGTVHHQCTFTVSEGLEALSEVVRHIETYDVTTIRASTPMFLMARRIRAYGVKMVLSGEGADEVFGGYLYFHKAPNREEFHQETIRKVKALNMFDCLRANKSTAAWGVEIRVPFLDPEFLEYAMGVDPSDKMINVGKGRIEKWMLRQAFQGYLPDEILWRQKEQFSDGVGYGWIDSLKAHAATQISDVEFANAANRFPHNTPASKEAYYYRQLFESHFPQPSAALCVPGGPSIACSTPTAILWDKAFQNMADPSGRAVIGVHASALSHEQSARMRN